MSGRLVFSSSNKILAKSILLLSLTVSSLFGCNAGTGNSQTVNVPSNKKTNDDKNKEKPDFSRLDKNRHLKPDETKDINALIKRFREADENERKAAFWLIEAADEEAAKKRWTVSGEGYLESIIVFPTVEGLLKTGEAICYTDARPQSKSELSEQKKKDFAQGLNYFETGRKFAVETNQEEELKKFPDLDEKISCLKLALIDLEKAEKTCSLVSASLRNNGL